MVYLLNIKIKDSLTLVNGLREVYGINRYRAEFFCKQLGISKNCRVKTLANNKVTKLLKLLESSKFVLNVDLKKLNDFNLKRLTNIKSYRGLRRVRGLPLRGQRTHTNAKTAAKFQQY